MCGQYYCDSTTFSFIEEETTMSPGTEIPVYLYYENRVILTKLTWGYSLPMVKELIINARCETLLQKPIFKQDMEERRCIIPAKGFYQKDAKQNRLGFENQEHDTLYMCGIYRKKEKEVVIITTKPNAIIKPIHNRMPLMIESNKVKQWLTNKEEAIKLLQYETSDLEIVSGHFQQILL